jgi:hypothetical protein
MELLKELKIKYIFQYSPKWIKPKKYDFYIPSMKLIIEMDGGLGHGSKDNNMNGMTKEESKAKDDYKDELAKLHNIKIIRINCDYNDTDVRFKFIKQNTINKLRNVFNLNNINWNKCDLFAGKSSLLLEVCKLKKENIVIPNEKLMDCGLMIYSDEQERFAGGSGPGCSAAVTFGHLVKLLGKGQLNKILVIATGALLSPLTYQQKESIPGIAHGVVLTRS